MALTTFNPPVKPSPGTNVSRDLKILEAEFGDGYSQPTPDGLNHIKHKVKLQWNGLTEVEYTAINAFFTARGGTEAFYYQPAGFSTPLKWRCKEWDFSLNGIWSGEALLEQTFTNES